MNDTNIIMDDITWTNYQEQGINYYYLLYIFIERSEQV